MKPKFLPPLLSLIAAVLLITPFEAESQVRNKDGSIVTGVLTAQFDPSDGILPFPSNLLYLGTTDLTLNPPVADPNDISDPAVALSGLDGFSTTEKWVATFVDDDGNPGAIDPASVVPGQSVRVFQVRLNQFVVVEKIERELQPGVEYTAAAAPGGVLAIIPLQPLSEYTGYMAVLTNDIRDANGNDATPDQTYFLTKRREPWLDENGNSTYPLIDNATAQGLAQLQPLTLSMEAAAAAFAGINPDDIVLSWTVQTQSITPTLSILSSLTEAAPVITAPTPFDTSLVNPAGPGLADIVIGVISVPYYHGIKTEETPFAPLTEYWKAAPGGYLPPFDQAGLDPTSTNLTFANPIPVLTGIQTVPLLITVPNEKTGLSKPESGWPVAIYIPSLTRNRTDMLALADTMASVGYAMVTMDQPMHGVVPEVEPQLAPFYIENTPFADIANERTFDADYFNNETGVFGPDGIPDQSGASYFNLANLRAVRDYLRQAQADFLVLSATIGDIDVDGDGAPDLNACNQAGISTSAGSFAGAAFKTLAPCITRAYINVAGGQALRSAEAGTFGVRIRAGLAAVGVFPGTPEFEQFLTVGTTVLDSGDSANWAKAMIDRIPVIHNEVKDDDTVPNSIPGSPLAGNSGLNRIMGLEYYDDDIANATGVSGVARFKLPARHDSLFRPAGAPEVTLEMQRQMATFIASGGTLVDVGDPSLLVPVMEPGSVEIVPPRAARIGEAGKHKPGVGGRVSAGKDGSNGWSPLIGSAPVQNRNGNRSGVVTPIMGDRQHD